MTDNEIRELARKLHAADGELEIDEGATVSRGDDPGAYVAAWVWVPFGEETSGEEEFEAPAAPEVSE